MKKSLSVLLSVAMSVSMFASVAFGAEAQMDTQAKYDALHAKGIFDGVDGGAAALDQTMTRAQFAKVLTLVFGLKEATGNSYTDLDGAGWAAGYIEAVTKAGLMDGVAVGKFDPSGNVTLEQLATVLVRGFKLQQSTDAVNGNVSDWAKGYVAAAVKAGLISASSDFSKAALRSDLVESTYTAVQKAGDVATNGQTSVDFKATGVQELTASFNNAVDTSKVTFAVTSNGNAVTVSKVTWSDDKKTATLALGSRLYKGDYDIVAKGAADKDLTGKVTVDDQKVSKIEIASDTAPILLDNSNNPTGAKVYYKVLDQYGDDVTKTSSIQWNVSVGSVSDNDVQNGVLTISTPTNYYLRVGDKFTITGIEQSTNTVMTKVLTVGDRSSASNVTVSKLYNPDGKTSVDTSNVSSFTLLLDVKDQYGNPLKAKDLNGTSGNNDGQLIVTSSNPALVKIPDQPFQDNMGPNSDQLGLTLAEPDNNGYSVEGTAVISFIPRFGGTSTTYNLDVKKGAQADVVNLSQPTTSVGTGETVEVPFTAVDQYGNAITKYSDLTSTGNGVTLQATNGTFVWESDASSDVGVLRYTAPLNYTGPVTLMAVTKSGKVSQISLDIKEPKVPGTVASLDMKTAMEAGAGLQVQGDHIKVQDQYGDNLAVDNASFYDKYKIKVELTGGFANASSGVTLQADGSNKAVQTDAFGNQLSAVTGNTYKTAEIYNSNGNINIVSTDTQQSINGGVKLSVVKKDGSDIKQTDRFGTTRDYTLSNYQEFPLKVVKMDSIQSYEIGNVAKVFDQNYKDPSPTTTFASDFVYDNYQQNMDVYGKLADGTKVSLNPNHIILTTSAGLGTSKPSNGNVGKVRANASGIKYDNSTDLETKGTVTAIITAKDNTTQSVSKDITISRDLPEAAKVTINNYATAAVAGDPGNNYEFNPAGNTVKTSVNHFSLADLLKEDAVITVKDQYGKHYPLKTSLLGNVAFLNVVDADNGATTKLTVPTGNQSVQAAIAAGLTGYGVGDSFTVVYTTPNGIVTTFKVKFVDDSELNYDNSIVSSLN